jgi:hypothetical protein
MRRLLIVLVASLVLGLVGGVGRAWAGDLIPPPSDLGTVQTATQSNDGSNSANQSATSQPTVVSGPNVAIANSGDSCNPCGGSGSTTQNSGNNVDASTSNNANQTNNQANGAGQTQTVDGGGSGNTSQSADQSNKGENTANQSATSEPVVVSGPNVAALNSGDVHQNSGNTVDASSSNDANQSNNQSNGAGQSQTVSDGDCCHSGGAEQSASQSNEGSNDANQSATSRPVVVSGGNYAIANKGDVNQNSGNDVDGSSSNTANQSNNQHNGAGQSQTVADGGSGCCSDHSGTSQSADQSNSGSNSANQSAYSAPVVVSGPNVAAFNGWGHDACNPCGGDGATVNQNSGNTVYAPSSNSATQTNNQSNGLGQTQSVDGGSGCCSGTGDVTQEATQSNHGQNTADQRAFSGGYVSSGGNYAFGNKGDVSQNSGNTVWAPSSNSATQTNNQSNGLGQTQTVNGSGSGCCSGTGDVTQSAEQSNWGSNSANQSAYSAPVVESGPNVAFGNGWGHDACNPCGGGSGTVNQNSGNTVWAPSSNTANQTNNQSNGLGQTQTVNGAGSGCCGSGDVTQSASQSNSGENSANQTAYSAPVVESGKNAAFFNHGDTTQNSGNNVNAASTNTATQGNNQSNNLGQSQTVDRGGCCPPNDCNPCNSCPPPPCEPKPCPPPPCEPKPCEPKPCPPPPCEPKPCEPKPCEPKTRQPKSNSGRGNLSETGTGTRQSNSSTLKNPHEGETGPGDHPTDDYDPGNSGSHNRGGD